MPKAITADWPLIQQLFIDGKTLPEIEAETGVKQGTVSARATRAGWKKTAAKAKAIMQKGKDVTLAIHEETTDNLSQSSSRVRNSLAQSLDRLAVKLDQFEPKTLHQAIRLQADLEPAVRNGKTVLGWTDGAPESLVRISLMEQCGLVTDTPQVIDVQSTKATLLSPHQPTSDAGTPFEHPGASLIVDVQNDLGSGI